MFYYFQFEDGYVMWARGLSSLEMTYEVRKHGKLIVKRRV